MPMEENEIKQLIKDSFTDAEVIITDLKGDGDHFAIHIISSLFKEKSRIQQHQMVYKALKGRMGNELHALAIKTSTP